MKNLFTLLVIAGITISASFSQQAQYANEFLNSEVNFRKNLGQYEDNILFQGANREAQIRFLMNGMSFAFIREKGTMDEAKEIMIWNVEFEGSRPDMNVTSDYKSDSKTNYLYGSDPDKWVINAPDYKKVSYNKLYENIDLHYYSVGRELKYDYVVNPGGDMSDIRMKISGVEDLDINRKGELEISTEWGTLLENTPYSYQVKGGVKHEVDVRYELLGNNTYGFKAYGEYDKSIPLVIDPVILNYCSYVAGNSGWSYINRSKVNKDGELFGIGKTTSHFPTTPGVYDNTKACCGGVPKLFAFRMNRQGTGLIYSTYVGAYGDQSEGDGLAIAPNNDIYVCAKVGDDFPVTANAYKKDGDFQGSAIFKLSSDGTQLLYSTFTDDRELKALAIDDDLDVYVTGKDGVVSKYSSDLSSKFYQKKVDDVRWGYDLLVTDNKEVYVAGSTYGGYKGTPGSYQPNNAGIIDGAIYHVSADGSTILNATALGGDDVDDARGITMGVNGNIYVTGQTMSTTDFKTTPGAYKTVNGCAQAYVTKLTPDLSTAIYSTFIGEGNYPFQLGCQQLPTDIAVSSTGHAVVTGYTLSPTFPATTCNTKFRDTKGDQDCFIVRLNEDGTDAHYSAIIAGSSYDYGGASDSQGSASVTLLEDACNELEAFVSISTHSYDWATTTGAFQEALPGGVDQPVVYDLKPVIEPEFSNSTPRCDQAVQFTDLTTGSCVENWATSNWSPSSWVWDFGDGTTSTLQNPSHFFAKPGRYEVKLRVMCPEDSITHIVDIPNPFNELELGQDINVCPEVPLNETLDAGNQPGGTTFDWSTGANTQSITVTTPGKYYVTISDGTCIASDTVNITQDKITGTIDKTQPSCAGSADGAIKALPSGGVEPFTYEWSNGQNTQTATGLPAGSVTIKVTDARGCILEHTTTLDEPDAITANVAVTDANCDGTGGGASATASGGAGGLMMEWTNGTVTETGSSVSDLPVGNYTLIVTDANNCEVTETFEVKQQESTVDVALTLKQDADCSGNGGSATVTPSGGQGPYTYEWSGGQTDRTVTNIGAGQHTVTVTDVNGCTDQLTIDIQSSGDLTAETSGAVVSGCDRSGAVNAEATVTVTGGVEPYTYQWDDKQQQTGATATGLPVGTYTVTVNDQGGCSATSTVVIEEIIQLDATSTDPSCAGCSDGQATVNVNGTGTPPFTYRWSDADQQTSETASGLPAGTYIVTVTDDQGCRSSDTVDVGNVTSVFDTQVEKEMINVFPNPATGIFKVDLSNIGGVDIKVMELNGKLVYENKVNSTANISTIDLSNKAEGIYLLQIQNERKVYYQKLYVQR